MYLQLIILRYCWDCLISFLVFFVYTWILYTQRTECLFGSYIQATTARTLLASEGSKVSCCVIKNSVEGTLCKSLPEVISCLHFPSSLVLFLSITCGFLLFEKICACKEINHKINSEIVQMTGGNYLCGLSFLICFYGRYFCFSLFCFCCCFSFKISFSVPLFWGWYTFSLSVIVNYNF